VAVEVHLSRAVEAMTMAAVEVHLSRAVEAMTMAAVEVHLVKTEGESLAMEV
jgi:hypothetical protein